MSTLLAWFLMLMQLLILLLHWQLMDWFDCAVLPSCGNFWACRFLLQYTQRTHECKMEPHPCAAAGSSQGGWSFEFLVATGPASVISCAVLSNTEWLFLLWLLNCEMEIWCPYVTEHLCYLIKQGATGVNKTTPAEGQESTLQLVTAGPLPEGPIPQLENMTMPEKYNSSNILSAKLALTGVGNVHVHLAYFPLR